MFEFLHRLRVRLGRVLFDLRYRKRFVALGAASFMFAPYRVEGAEGISLGKASSLQSGSWLYCKSRNKEAAQLKIGSHCVLGYNNHITAIDSVCIGDHVLTANNVYISDNVHSYEDIATPVMDQPVILKGRVEIGDGTWLGENVVVIGASIGKNCVIGANAVVTHDIPDYCVAVGIPAKVIRRYDHELASWVSAL